jgi:hypothetical protein
MPAGIINFTKHHMHLVAIILSLQYDSAPFNQMPWYIW